MMPTFYLQLIFLSPRLILGKIYFYVIITSIYREIYRTVLLCDTEIYTGLYCSHSVAVYYVRTVSR